MIECDRNGAVTTARMCDLIYFLVWDNKIKITLGLGGEVICGVSFLN